MRGASEFCGTQSQAQLLVSALSQGLRGARAPCSRQGAALPAPFAEGAAGLSHLGIHRLEIEQAHTTPTQARITQSNKNICTFRDDSNGF